MSASPAKPAPGTSAPQPPEPVAAEADDVFGFRNFPAILSLCDENGIMVRMSRESIESYAESGGAKLLGADIHACHPEPARTKVRQLLAGGKKNVYTIEKGGRRKLVYQAPWIVDGKIRGFLDLTLELPADMPHFKRD